MRLAQEAWSARLVALGTTLALLGLLRVCRARQVPFPRQSASPRAPPVMQGPSSPLLVEQRVHLVAWELP